MKFLHLSDLHIGKIVNGFNMLDDQRFALEGIVRIAGERKLDAVVIAGDLYDKAAPSAEAVQALDWFISELVKRHVVVLGIPGNHDSAERVAYAQSILEKQGVYFPPLFNGQVHRVKLEDEFGPVNFWLLPFLKPAQVRPFFPEEEIQTDYTRALECALSACELDDNERNVLVAHQFVTAQGHQTERSASELNLGGLDNVDSSVFDAFDYVALGHIHRAQRIGRNECRYAGSLLKYSLSESLQKKSAVLVELGPKNADNQENEKASCVSYELIEYPIKHDMRVIKGRLAELTDKSSLEKSFDYVHAVLTDEVLPLATQAKLRAMYPNLMSFTKEITASASDKNQAHTSSNEIELNPEKLFANFFEEQTGKNMNGTQADLVRKLMNESAQATLTGKEA